MSRTLWNPCCWVVALVLFAGTAVAQQPQQQQQPPTGDTYIPGTFSPPYYGGGYGGGGFGGGGYGGFGGWGWGGWGGTVAGNYLMGLGRAIRAQGQYNLDTSAARINLEEARSRQIDNRKLWTKTYFEMRDINNAWRDAHRPKRGDAETWMRLAQRTAPARLSTSELDPVTGRIMWPPGLDGPGFKTQRDKLDVLFADRAEAHGAIGVEKHGEIRELIDEMLAELKDRIRQYETRQYLASRNFLTSLRHEATLPTTGYAETASTKPVPPPVRTN